MLTREQKQRIKDNYFAETLDVSKLSPDEYQYWYDEFAIADKTENVISFLYFDFSGYGFVSGKIIKRYDRYNELIDSLYKISRYEKIAIQDRVEEKIKGEGLIYSNMTGRNTLHGFLTSAGVVLEPTDELDFEELEWGYLNLCGQIESQNSRKDRDRFNLLGSKFVSEFRSDAKEVDRINKSIPLRLLALIYWYTLGLGF